MPTRGSAGRVARRLRRGGPAARPSSTCRRAGRGPGSGTRASPRGLRRRGGRPRRRGGRSSSATTSTLDPTEGMAREHVRALHDVLVVGAGRGQRTGPCPGGHDDGVDLGRRPRRRPLRAPQLDLHPRARRPFALPRDPVRERAVQRARAAMANWLAEVVGALPQRDGVADLGRQGRHLQPAGPPPTTRIRRGRRDGTRSSSDSRPA